MNKQGMIKEFARTAMDYGQAFYQYHESLELVKRQKRTLLILQKWETKPETRRVSAHALESLRQEILTIQQRIWADTRHAKSLASEVAQLQHVLEAKTRQLVAAR